MDDPKLFDCVSCRGKYHRCLIYERKITFNQPDFGDGHARREWTVSSPDDVQGYLDYAVEAQPMANEIEHLLELAGVNICPIPMFSYLSKDLARLSDVYENGLFPYSGGYFEQLAIFVQAASIVSMERAAVRKAKRNPREK